MKSIYTLIPDIYELLNKKERIDVDTLSRSLGARLTHQLSFTESPRGGRLRLSQMGPKCPKALWYSYHKPELAEALPPWAEFKYLYGHIIEDLVIQLAKAAGHTVEGEQDELCVDDVIGHRDCVIDGCIVDVKSSATRSFEKFKDGSLVTSDSFGYLDQLDGYLVGSLNDPLVTVKDRGYILAIDKQLGHMVLYEHFLREDAIRERIKYYKQIVGRSSPPPCECGTERDGQSGNIKLTMQASYNPYKYSCFPDLRTFLYAKGPVYLTKVVRKPDVPEIDRFGKLIRGAP